jgi:hypothetical protein
VTSRIAASVLLASLAVPFFSVTATNGAGMGPSSDPSAAVTPLAPVAVSGATYHAMTPVRVLDTRSGIGLGGKLVANTPATFGVGGRGGIPIGASAVSGNVTVVGPSNSWAVYLGPAPIANPATSTINFGPGEVAGNGLTVALSETGTLSATYMSTAGNTTDLVFDVTGFFTPDTSGATYHPISPTRLLDTRAGNGLGDKLRANVPATFAVGGRAGVPSNATAVSGNVTVVNPSFSWAVYLGPIATATPSTSTINFGPGDVKGNSLTVSLGSGGTLSATYMSTAGNTTDLVFDVTGYYTADLSGAMYVPITPTRLLDTRSANGLPTRLSANTPATFQVTGRGGIPGSATAATGNVTVVNERNGWAVFLGPDPTPSPSTSTINFGPGDVKGNGLTVALGSGGTGILSATYMSTAGSTTDLVFDVTGYFVPSAPPLETWTLDLYDPRAERYQDPDRTACTAAATVSMLNTVSYSGSAAGLVWQPTTSYSTQEEILAYERANMTMLTSSAGTDPHGWRNALNYYGWGSINAGVYRDSAYASFDAAAKAAVSALARYHKPVGILAMYGVHSQFITGYEVTGDDPATGSSNFSIVGVDLTDPYQIAGHLDTWVTYGDWLSGGPRLRFSQYLQDDSPYRDPVDGRIGHDEWYGNWVIIDPVK